MLAVPVGGGLIGVTGAHQHLFPEVTPDKLERDGGSGIGEPARFDNCAVVVDARLYVGTSSKSMPWNTDATRRRKLSRRRMIF
jgi:hypothetical protein